MEKKVGATHNVGQSQAAQGLVKSTKSKKVRERVHLAREKHRRYSAFNLIARFTFVTACLYSKGAIIYSTVTNYGVGEGLEN